MPIGLALLIMEKSLLVDDKSSLMQRMGSKQLMIELRQSITNLPDELLSFNLELSDEGDLLTYSYDTRGEKTGITALLQTLSEVGIGLKDLKTSQSSLEQIFVSLVSEK